MTSFKDIIRLFGFAGWRRQSLTMFVILLGGLAENLSIASLWPIIEISSGNPTGDEGAARVIVEALGMVGLPASLGTLLIFMCAFITLKFLLSSAAAIHIGHDVARMATEMRIALIRAIVNARWSRIINTPGGRLSAAVGDECDRASSAYRSATVFGARLTETLAYLAGCLWISWQFSLAAAAGALLLWLAAARFVAVARRAGRRRWESTHLLSTAIDDLMVSMKSLRAMNRQAFLGEVAEEQVRRLRKAAEREYFNEAAVRALQEPMLASMMVCGLFVGHSFFDLNLGAILGTAWLLKRISTSVTGMRNAVQRVAIDGIAFRSVQQLTAAMRQEAESLHGGADAHLRHDCVFERVLFGYGDRRILDQAGFRMRAGEVAVLLGPSGAGKTTIADLIAGLHDPQSGEVLIDGAPLATVDLARWRGRIGYVPQESILFNDSVRENITLGDQMVADHDVIEALKLSGAWEFVSALPMGLDEPVGIRGNRLSGGQKQRLSIARALIHNPELLILDEATSALDQATALGICDSIRRLRGKCTVLAITHQPLWLDVADMVFMIHQGGIRRVRYV